MSVASVVKETRILTQRSIFDALQRRLADLLEETASDAMFDADQLSDLSTAVRCAAETLEVLEGEE